MTFTPLSPVGLVAAAAPPCPPGWLLAAFLSSFLCAMPLTLLISESLVGGSQGLWRWRCRVGVAGTGISMQVVGTGVGRGTLTS